MILLDKIKATAHINSVKLPSAAKNGNVVALGGLEENEREIYKGVAPAAITDEVVFIANPFLAYDERLEEEKNYALKQGEVVRAYVLEKGDIVTVTKDLITGTPVAKQFVSLEAGKIALKASSTKPAASLVFVVEAIETAVVGLAGQDGVVLRVL